MPLILVSSVELVTLEVASVSEPEQYLLFKFIMNIKMLFLVAINSELICLKYLLKVNYDVNVH